MHIPLQRPRQQPSRNMSIQKVSIGLLENPPPPFPPPPPLPPDVNRVSGAGGKLQVEIGALGPARRYFPRATSSGQDASASASQRPGCKLNPHAECAGRQGRRVHGAGMSSGQSMEWRSGILNIHCTALAPSFSPLFFKNESYKANITGWRYQKATRQS